MAAMLESSLRWFRISRCSRTRLGLICFWLLCCVTTHHVVQSRRHPQRRRLHHGGKPRIRGAPGDCAGLLYNIVNAAGLPPPCRIDDPEDFQASGYQPQLPPSNQMSVGVYLGLMPHRKSLGPMATGVSAAILNEKVSRLNIHLSKGYAHPHRRNVTDGMSSKVIPIVDSAGSSSSANNGANNDDNGSSRHLLQIQNFALADLDRPVDMFHTISDSKLIEKHNIRWWWHVNMTFECFWGETKPLPMQHRAMVFIRGIVDEIMGMFQDDIETRMQAMTKDGGIRVRIESAGIPTEEEDEADLLGVSIPTFESPTSEPTGPDETFSSDTPTSSPTPPVGHTVDSLDMKRVKQLDPDKWDWTKSLGLFLLLATTSATVVLKILGFRRKYEREKRQFWGSLRSQDGVQQLLNTGWVLEGSEMQIYDKSKMGYSDDDSVFLGGFEQKEAVVGTEVTITHPETSDNTRQGSGSLLSSQQMSSQHLSSGSFTKHPYY